VARPTQDDLVDVIRRADVADERIIQAFKRVRREDYVPTDLKERAYFDDPLPIPHRQVTTQPSLSAKMIDALQVGEDDIVLEVGTGYGFQTALLSRLARFVHSIERWADLADVAQTNLEHGRISNVSVVVGDGSAGLPEPAPFDRILVSAAFPRVPSPLVNQLADGGRLVQPIGMGGYDEVVAFEKRDCSLSDDRHVTPASFVRLYGAHGFEEG
jgi:protein-L-isoaspartate(D-aspartate) O-methyltransferase